MSWIDENGVQHKGDLQITSGSPYDKRGEDYNKAIEEAKGDPAKVQAARDALRQGRIDDYKAQIKAANDEYSKADAAAEEEYNRAYSNLLALDQSQLPAGYIDNQLKMADQKRQQAKASARAKNKSAVSALKPPAGYNPKDDKEAVRGIVEEEEEKAKAEEDAKAKADDAAKSKETTTTTTEKKVQPAGAALFSGLSAAAGKMIYGKSGDPMGRNTHLNRQAEMHDREAAKHDVASQKENQIANRDERRETSKDAQADGQTQSEDIVNKLGNVGAGASALARVTGKGDLNANRNRKDQARQKGVENMEKAEDERQLAEQERSGADVYDYQARDMQVSNQESDELSEGKGDVVEDTTKKEEDKKVEDNTKVDPPDPEKEKPEKAAEPVEGNWQEAINLLSYGADESSQHYNNGANEADGQRLLDSYDAKPLTMQQVQDYVNKKRPKDAALLWEGGQWTNGQSKNEFLTFGKNDPRRAQQAGLLQDAIGYYYPKLYEDWKASGQTNGRFDANGKQINAGQKLADGTTATGAGFVNRGKMTITPDTQKNIRSAIGSTAEGL